MVSARDDAKLHNYLQLANDEGEKHCFAMTKTKTMTKTCVGVFVEKDEIVGLDEISSCPRRETM